MIGSDDLARAIGPVLKRLYPHNPDIVLGREARFIADALLPLIQAEIERDHDITDEELRAAAEQVYADQRQRYVGRDGDPYT